MQITETYFALRLPDGDWVKRDSADPERFVYVDARAGKEVRVSVAELPPDVGPADYESMQPRVEIELARLRSEMGDDLELDDTLHFPDEVYVTTTPGLDAKRALLLAVVRTDTGRDPEIAAAITFLCTYEEDDAIPELIEEAHDALDTLELGVAE